MLRCPRWSGGGYYTNSPEASLLVVLPHRQVKHASSDPAAVFLSPQIIRLGLSQRSLCLRASQGPPV